MKKMAKMAELSKFARMAKLVNMAKTALMTSKTKLTNTARKTILGKKTKWRGQQKRPKRRLARMGYGAKLPNGHNSLNNQNGLNG